MSKNRYKETLETLYIYGLPKNFFEAAIKENLFFAFFWNMVLMCIPIYNLEPDEYFRRVFVEVYVIVL